MRKIIIPTDIMAILEKERSFLNRSDIRTFKASTNTQTLGIHKSEKVNLIVAKLDSQDMSGEILCSQIRNDIELRKVSIILVCPDTDTNIKRCLECSANSFVTIPVKSAVLLQEIYQLLNIALRRSCRLGVKIKVQGTKKKRPFTASTENISLSGMLFTTPARLSEGDTVKCSLSIPGSEQINTEAEIVRVVEQVNNKDICSYGAKFIEVDTASISTLKGFVESECKNS